MENIFEYLDLNISNEIIESQIDDPVIEKIKYEFQSLIDIINNGGYNSSEIYESTIPMRHLKNIDTEVYKRFGIKIKHTYSQSALYGVLVTSPKKHSVLKDNVVANYNTLNTLVKNRVQTRKNEYIHNSDSDQLNMFIGFNKSIKALDQTMRQEGVKIDLQKAYIHNLPSDYIGFLVSNLSKLVTEFSATSEELTAILLHEVGHAFTHIEYTYRTVRDTVVVMDTIRDNIEKNNTSPKKALRLAYERINGDKKSVSKSNESSIFIKISQQILEPRTNDYSQINSEQLADQFASRFGLGLAVVSILDKFPKDDLVLISLFKNVLLLSTIYYCIGAIQFIGTFSLVTLVGLGIISIAVNTIVCFLVFSAIVKLFSTLATQGGTSGAVYDTNIRRYQRIKNDIIRQIRNSNLPKAAIKVYMDSIKTIDTIIKGLGDDEKISIIDKVYRVVFRRPKELLENRQIDQLIEDLSENEVHLAHNKLRLMI